MLSLHRMILETIAYYDVFDYPLTEFEVWRLLIASDGEGERVGPVSLRNVLDSLHSSFLQKRTGRHLGFVFLRGREELISRRIRLEKRAYRGIAGAHRVAKLASFFPFVRMIGLTGSLSMKNADGKSDWDFFVVLESGHIWTGRAIMTAALHMLGLRRHGRFVAKRACLNSWVTTSSLEIRLKDIFSSNEYLFLIPLFGRETFNRFQLENVWMRRFRPNFHPNQSFHQFQITDSAVSKFVRTFLERLASPFLIESNLRIIQQRKIAANPKTKSPEGFIEATDDRLIFLPKPRGPKVFEMFCRRMSDVESATMQ